MFRLLGYIKPYWRIAILAPIFMFIEVIMDLMQPTLLAKIVDEGIKQGDMSLVIKTGLIMIGVAILGFSGGVGCIAASSCASTDFGTDLREDVFRKIQTFSFANLDKFKTESLITRLTNDIMQIQNALLMAMRMLVRAPLLFIGGIIMAVRINAQLALIFVVAIPVLIAFLLFISKKGFPLFNLVQKKLDRVNAVTRENLSGVRLIKAFVRNDLEKSRFDVANNELVDVTVKASRLMMIIMPVMMLIMNISMIAVMWLGGVQWVNGTMDIGEIMAFVNYLMLILMSLMMVTFVLVMLSRAKASADRVNEVLDTMVDVEDAKDALDIKIKNGSVEFKDVSFGYNPGAEPVLKSISFKINPGETIAILGGTGSGKTSLINLIPRLYDATKGSVLVDGRNVKDYRLETLRQGISVVLQDAILFSGTIKENIRWGREDATDEEVMEAARIAQAHDFIEGFKEGYDTELGQRGVNLSGGQRQRLSIARAIIKNPSILILDDSTSAVDMGTEYRIQQGLKQKMKKTTCIVIAQRISSVVDADRILILEDGKIAGQGSHDELIKTNPIYQEIYKSQLGEEALLNVQ